MESFWSFTTDSKAVATPLAPLLQEALSKHKFDK
jgi:hypothetical protein